MKVIGFMLLAGVTGLMAQQAAAPAQAMMPQQKEALTIKVLEGEGARNSIRGRTAIAPVVEVRDEAEKLVVGAEVVFQLPPAGPGGVFNGWLRNQTSRTDEKGVARVTGYTPNDQEGRFNIKVTATSGTKTGSAVIAQVNVQSTGTEITKGRSSLWWKLLVGAGAGAAIGGIVAANTGGTSTPTPTTPVSITVGAVTVSGPR